MVSLSKKRTNEKNSQKYKDLRNDLVAAYQHFMGQNEEERNHKLTDLIK